MEEVRSFLEFSTIHGLANISTVKGKIVKIFWLLVVIGGFTGAGVMIYNSFKSWADSPVKTTIETLSITEITFPKVTVCPPKNTYTDLNYDLIMTENMTLDNDTRQELTNYALELLYDHLYDIMMRNLSKVEENNRYYNWYHGYTKIELPYYDTWDIDTYYVYTAASSGSISTQFFGEQFDADKVETLLLYNVYVYPPASVRKNTNVMLHLDVEKVSLEDLSSGYKHRDRQYDRFYVQNSRVNTTQRSFNFTPPTSYNYKIKLDRDVLTADVKKQKQNFMPGFRYTWHYSGIDVEPWAKYINHPRTMAFIRNYSIMISKPDF